MNKIDPAGLDGEHFDVVIVGTGFGSSFYLKKLLERAAAIRILVVEWGDHRPHDWQIGEGVNSTISAESTYRSTSSKPWNFTVGFGGGTNCWFAQSPRFLPSDFELHTRYGVGIDWPISYGDLEPYYLEAETIMSVSGDPDMARVMPRSGAFPQPPHRLTAVDRIMKQAQPDQHFAMPTARARIATEQRSACCASFRCNLCPVDAKFTANNGLRQLYEDPRVSLALKTRAIRFAGSGGVVRSLAIEANSREMAVTADRFVLGANAIHSPAILLNSDMGGGLTGVGLNESYGCNVEVLLDGVDNFDGSTITTGLNFGLYDGDFRSRHGAALVYFENRWMFGLRMEKGRWRQTAPLMVVVEDLLEPGNKVVMGRNGTPQVEYAGPSEYAKLGLQRALEKLPTLLAPLPVERIEFRSHRPTESHLQGTLRMGSDPASSVIDAKMIHHSWKNLTVVGSATFPSCSCANPSLTVAALSLRAAALA